MARDIFVRWKAEVPSKEEIQACLEDYVRGLAEKINWERDRFFVMLPGQFSFPFDRVGPWSARFQREGYRELKLEDDGTPRPRWFEVYLHKDCIDVITRMQDEVTNNIAKGFAVLCARGWQGEIEE